MRCAFLTLPAWLAIFAGVSAAPQETALRFEVTVADGLLKEKRDGRMVVVLGREKGNEPRRSIGVAGRNAAPMLGADADRFGAGSMVVLDRRCVSFPFERLEALPAGTYRAQAVFHHNRDLNHFNSPGNLYSEPVTVTIDPAAGGAVKLVLTKALADEKIPDDTQTLKFLKLKSELLSKHHGRPMYLRAGLALPANFDKEPNRKYPLRVHIGGYGSRYTAIRQFAGRSGDFLVLHLDGAGPYGDPYQVNSANHGPYGDAVTQELIPHVEKLYRGIGAGHARVTDGTSTGGWVSLALQVFYPDFFNGCWSHAPDPVDFRAFELVNIYDDANAYVNGHGFERPAARDLNGEPRYTMRHECLMERVMGRGNRWELSGQDWCAWNATFGPRGKDGFPVPLWDGATGKLDRSAVVLDQWKKYDLRRVLSDNWGELAPKLNGKINIFVGDADDYFLNNAVRLLDTSLRRVQPAFEGTIRFGPAGGHGWRGLSDKDILAGMTKAVTRGKTGP